MSRAESKAQTRERLLEAAAEVFEAKGFNAATIEEIVERAGFTRGAFYAHFPDKAEVMWVLAEQLNQQAFDRLSAGLDAADLDDKLGVAQTWFEGLMGTRPLRRAMDELLLQAGETPEGKRRMAGIFAEERRNIATTLEKVAAVLGIELPIPVEHLAAMGLAVGNGLAMQHLVDPEAVPTSLFANAQAYLWLGAIAADEQNFIPGTGTPSPRP